MSLHLLYNYYCNWWWLSKIFYNLANNQIPLQSFLHWLIANWIAKKNIFWCAVTGSNALLYPLVIGIVPCGLIVDLYFYSLYNIPKLFIWTNIYDRWKCLCTRHIAFYCNCKTIILPYYSEFDQSIDIRGVNEVIWIYRIYIIVQIICKLTLIKIIPIGLFMFRLVRQLKRHAF